MAPPLTTHHVMAAPRGVMAAPRVDASIGGADALPGFEGLAPGSPPSPHLVVGCGGGGLLPDLAAATRADDLPVDFWTCVLNAVACGRCVAGAAGAPLRLLTSSLLPPRPLLLASLAHPTPFPFFLFTIQTKSPSLPRPPPRDAASLACVSSKTAEAYRGGRWTRTVRIKNSGAVLEPASGAFDVTVAPGANVQAAVDRCPAGGCVLLLPGTHDGPLLLSAGKVVHVFGRARATLRATAGGSILDVLTSEAATSTVDGLILRQEATGPGNSFGVAIRGGALRLQSCVVSGAKRANIEVSGGAGTDPVITGCTCVGGGHVRGRISLPSLLRAGCSHWGSVPDAPDGMASPNTTSSSFASNIECTEAFPVPSQGPRREGCGSLHLGRRHQGAAGRLRHSALRGAQRRDHGGRRPASRCLHVRGPLGEKCGFPSMLCELRVVRTRCIILSARC